MGTEPRFTDFFLSLLFNPIFLIIFLFYRLSTDLLFVFLLPSNNTHSKLDQAVTTLTCILDVPSSNLGRDTDYSA
jgi:hypothetical protein